MSERVFIGLGSNLDDPLQQLQQAVSALRRHDDLSSVRVSSVYRTRAVGQPGQQDYLNAVVECYTELDPASLLQQLHQIENAHGRQRQRRWDSRTLDLDILLYGHHMVHTADLTIPHPGMHERAFVLYPLSELDESLEIPGTGPLQSLFGHDLQGEVLEHLDVSL